MLTYISTRDENLKLTPAEAIIQGLAVNGGLFVPSNLEDIKVDYKNIIQKDYLDIAEEIFTKFFPDLAREIPTIVKNSYTNKFSDESITPLIKLNNNYILELFLGPTCAFKDVALSALPNLMMAAIKKANIRDHILILTATSGDTGSAAMKGFSNVPNTSIITFYPDDGISDIQRLQMTTQEATNVTACAIKGNFDVAQSGVKEIFKSLKGLNNGVMLSSANSINIGRLVPQIVYYFSAYKQLVDNSEIKIGDEITFTVPTGNFGNIMAGWFAMKMGLPIKKLYCASNKNNVLTEFLKTGHYNKNRGFFKTTSPSMDILVSSNLERLLYYICGSENTAKYMNDLANTGEYQIEKEELEKIQEIFVGIYSNDNDGASAIDNVFQANSYLMDTHTAIAYASYKNYQDDNNSCYKNVILATASPYKFPYSVLEALKQDYSLDDKQNLIELQEVTNSAMPEQLSKIFEKKIYSKDVIHPENMRKYVEDKIAEICNNNVNK